LKQILLQIRVRKSCNRPFVVYLKIYFIGSKESPSKELPGKKAENIVGDFPLKSPITVNIKDLLIQKMLNEKVLNICK